MEPPTGMPRKKPARMLPAPWPMKSRSTLAGRPSGLGKPADTPAPCTRPTKARAIAGTNSSKIPSSDGRTGRGKALGTSATSPSTWTFAPKWVNAAARAEPMAMATTRPSPPSLVCWRIRMSAIVTIPTVRAAPSICVKLRTVSMARETRLEPSASYAVRSPIWPRMMLMPTAVMKPVMTALETKRSTKPSRRSPATAITMPVRIVSVNSAVAGSSKDSRPASATMMAMAPVPCTAMNDELVKNEPPSVP